MLNLQNERKSLKVELFPKRGLQNQNVLRNLNFEEAKGLQYPLRDLEDRKVKKKRELEELDFLRLQRVLKILEMKKESVERFIEEIKKVTDWKEEFERRMDLKRIKKKVRQKELSYQYCATCLMKGGCSGDYRTCGKFHHVEDQKSEETID